MNSRHSPLSSAFGQRTLPFGDPRHGHEGYADFECRCGRCIDGEAAHAQKARREQRRVARLLNRDKAEIRRAEKVAARHKRVFATSQHSGSQIAFISYERGVKARENHEPNSERLWACDELELHGPGVIHWHLRSKR